MCNTFDCVNEKPVVVFYQAAITAESASKSECSCCDK